MQQNSYTPGNYKSDESKQYVELFVESMDFDKLTAWAAYTSDKSPAGRDYSFVKGTTQRMAPYFGDKLITYFSYCCGMENANWSLNTTYVEG